MADGDVRRTAAITSRERTVATQSKARTTQVDPGTAGAPHADVFEA
jgi:hypothetical protein